MNELLARAAGFFFANTPSWTSLSVGAPLGLAWSFTALWLAGRLKRAGTRTAYTRKTFHFLIFGTVAVLEWRLGTPAVCLFGATCTVAVFVAVWRGPGNVLYEAIAREQDEPRRTLYVLVPYFATLLGGLAANILCGPVAVAGYLVTGLGDAVGEPVGARFGAHRYRVPSLSSVPAVRSLEGSAAVFVMSAIALLVAAAVSPAISVGGTRAWAMLLTAAVCAAVEAVSPHGWDNLALQIVPTILARLWLSA
jgi:phytol kinase